MPNQHIGIYGNIKIPRTFCRQCSSWAMVIDGLRQCCGRKTEVETTKIRRITQADARRKSPSIADKKAILEIQKNQCLYCEKEFGDIVFRDNNPLQLRLHWDHMVPYVYSQNNYAYNFCAACHVCNHIKYSMMFQTLDEAKVYIQDKRLKKGYSF